MVLPSFDSPTDEMCFPQLFGKATESAERTARIKDEGGSEFVGDTTFGVRN